MYFIGIFKSQCILQCNSAFQKEISLDASYISKYFGIETESKKLFLYWIKKVLCPKILWSKNSYILLHLVSVSVVNKESSYSRPLVYQPHCCIINHFPRPLIPKVIKLLTKSSARSSSKSIRTSIERVSSEYRATARNTRIRFKKRSSTFEAFE